MGFYTDVVAQPQTEHHFKRNALMQEWLTVFQIQARQYTMPVSADSHSDNSINTALPHTRFDSKEPAA
jgi:hypothetical protein